MPKPQKKQGNIKRTEGELAAARKHARKAAQGQLDAIGGNIPNHRFTRKSAKIMAGLERQQKSAAAFGERQLAGINKDSMNISKSVSATGARGSVKDAMITNARKKAAKRDSRFAEGVAGAATQLGKGLGKVGEKALDQQDRVDKRVAKTSNTILGVLESERAMMDERFVAELRAEKADRKFQVHMLDLQTEASKELATFENNMPLAKSDKQAARLQYKYDIMRAEAEAKLLSAGEGNKSGGAFTKAIQDGSEVAAAAAHYFNSDAGGAAVNAIMNPEVGTDGKPITDIPAELENGATRSDVARYLIKRRVSDLAGSLDESTVNKIVYDVVRNDGQLSPKYVAGAVASQDEDWGSLYGSKTKVANRLAFKAMGLTKSNPEKTHEDGGQQTGAAPSSSDFETGGGNFGGEPEKSLSDRFRELTGWDFNPSGLP